MSKSTRMAFICDDKLYYKFYTFEFASGFAISQKRKNINSFHEEIKKDGIVNVLEVSRKNENEIGILLSAFNLMLTIENKKYPVECIYQSSKRFGDVQYNECQYMDPAEAKKYIKEKVENNNLCLTEFRFANKSFSLNPKSMFYDYLYIYSIDII